MKRIGIFADVSNLYYCIGKHYGGKKLDYKKYYDFIVELGEIKLATAYGAQIGNESANFIYCLKQIGFTPKYKCPKSYNNDKELKRKADWDVGIAIDIVNTVDRLDIIVLGSADGDLCPVVEWAQLKGVKVIILACGISRDLKNLVSEYIEIPETMLEDEHASNKTAG